MATDFYDRYSYRLLAYVSNNSCVWRSRRAKGDKRGFFAILRSCPSNTRAAVVRRVSMHGGPREIIAMRIDLPYTCHEVYETVEAAIAAAVLGAPLGAKEGD